MISLCTLLAVSVASVLIWGSSANHRPGNPIVAIQHTEASTLDILAMAPEVIMDDVRRNQVLDRALRSRHDDSWWRSLLTKMTTASACPAYSVPWNHLVGALLVRARAEGITIEADDETGRKLSGVYVMLPTAWPREAPMRVYARFSTPFPSSSTSGGWSWSVERRDPDKSKKDSWLAVASSADAGAVPFNLQHEWRDSTFLLPGAAQDSSDEIELRWTCSTTSKKDPKSTNNGELHRSVTQVANMSVMIRKAYKDNEARPAGEFVARLTKADSGDGDLYMLVLDSLPSDKLQPPAAREFDVTAGVCTLLIDDKVAWTCEAWWDWRRPSCDLHSPWGFEGRVFSIPTEIGLRASRKDVRLKFTFTADATIALRAFCAKSFFNCNALSDVVLDRSLGIAK